MSSLKNQLIRLGETNPELRDHLRPILDRIARGDAYTEADADTTMSTRDIEQDLTQLLREFAEEINRDSNPIGWKSVQLWRSGGDGNKDEYRIFIESDVKYEGGRDPDVSAMYPLPGKIWDQDRQTLSQFVGSSKNVNEDDATKTIIGSGGDVKMIAEEPLQEGTYIPPENVEKVINKNVDISELMDWFEHTFLGYQINRRFNSAKLKRALARQIRMSGIDWLRKQVSPAITERGVKYLVSDNKNEREWLQLILGVDELSRSEHSKARKMLKEYMVHVAESVVAELF